MLKTECKYSQYCTPLTQSDCRYFLVLAIKLIMTCYCQNYIYMASQIKKPYAYKYITALAQRKSADRCSTKALLMAHYYLTFLLMICKYMCIGQNTDHDSFIFEDSCLKKRKYHAELSTINSILKIIKNHCSFQNSWTPWQCKEKTLG